MIVLITPTRNRPELCKRMIDSARATADGPIEIFLGIASEKGNYPQEYNHLLAQKVLVEEMPTVAVSNMLAEEAMCNSDNKLFFMIGDDAVFETKGWDSALIKAYNKLDCKIHVFSLQDSRDKDGTPHPIATREYIEAMGYFMCPIFLHWYVDTWISVVAKSMNCFTKLDDYILKHEKAADSGAPDDTHIRIRRNGYRERDAFVNEKCQVLLDEEKRRLFFKVMESN